MTHNSAYHGEKIVVVGGDFPVALRDRFLVEDPGDSEAEVGGKCVDEDCAANIHSLEVNVDKVILLLVS